MSKYGYFLAFIIPALVVAGFYLGGWWNMLTVGFVFLIEPFLDSVSGFNNNNFEGEKAEIESEDRFYKVLLYLWVFVQLILLVCGWHSMNEWGWYAHTCLVLSLF